jgi:high affinity sulfate transporter 1
MPTADTTPALVDRLARFAPGLPALAHYQGKDLPHDLMAGVSVAAVALPVGVAYAQLAGFPPVVGLYASILPLIAYALFGTSRQLIVGPDAATCALVATAVTPLAGTDADLYLSLSVVLAFLAGVFCIAASFLCLGALADFLSRPILVGFLNGVALHIILGQVGKLFGIALDEPGILPRALEFAMRLGETHLPTLGVGLIAIATLAVAPRLLRRLPAALIAMAVTAALVALLRLDGLGLAVIGAVPAGLPELRLPSIPLGELAPLVGAAAGIALVSFSSAMLTARSFAAKNHYEVDVDREFAALGAANIASALSQGFAISGADSRTAMNDASGGRTQVAGVIAALTVGLVLLFLTEPLRYVPIAALAAVLIRASFSLMDIQTLRQLWQLERPEFWLSIIVTLGVIWVGSIDAIVIAVGLAILRFVRLVARPTAETLGQVEGMPGFHPVNHHEGARTIPGLVLFRFNSPLVFFNAPYFKRCALDAADEAGSGLKWFVLDALPVTNIDVTGFTAVTDLAEELERRGAQLVLAGRRTQAQLWAQKRGMTADDVMTLRFPTLRQAVRAYKEAHRVRAPNEGVRPEVIEEGVPVPNR